MKTSKINLQACINWMWTELKVVNSQVADDHKDAKKDFHHFLTWGDAACGRVAYQKWLNIYIGEAKRALVTSTVEEIVNLWASLLLRERCYSVKSSGIMGNVMENYDITARAKIISEIQAAIQHGTFL